MAELIFSYRGEQIFRHRIVNHETTIGRNTNCDIHLSNNYISKLHCKIIKQLNNYTIRDESLNGTLLNSKNIEKEITLSENDLITIGDWQITFTSGSKNDICKTVIVPTKSTKILNFDCNTNNLEFERIKVRVYSGNGSKDKKFFDSTPILVGSSDICDLTIDDPYISKKHCVIYRHNGHYILKDLQSSNGTIIHERRIDEEVMPVRTTALLGKTTLKITIEETTERITESPEDRLESIIGKSQRIQYIYSIIKRTAPSDSTILITGESGTGKELAAQAIHRLSTRGDKPFVALNCGSIPETIIESELFGHERGAFTGAVGTHKGVFEQTNGGTLFLDEIGEMPHHLQTRLLRVLENKTIRRVGGDADIPINVRIVAATNQDLKSLTNSNKFRLDLYYRLMIIPVHMPPLRERVSDIELLTKHFIDELSPNNVDITITAIDKLKAHLWPGNVRELKNVIQRALLFCCDCFIKPEDIELYSDHENELPPVKLEFQEKESITKALKQFEGNQAKVSRYLGIARTTLRKKLNKFNIDPIHFKNY